MVAARSASCNAVACHSCGVINAQGEFLLTTPRMSVPETGTIYSVNEGNSQYWDAAMTQCAAGLANSRPPQAFLSEP